MSALSAKTHQVSRLTTCMIAIDLTTVRFYNGLRENDKSFEIIYVSNDKYADTHTHNLCLSLSLSLSLSFL